MRIWLNKIQGHVINLQPFYSLLNQKNQLKDSYVFWQMTYDIETL